MTVHSVWFSSVGCARFLLVDLWWSLEEKSTQYVRNFFWKKLIISSDDELKHQFESSTCRLQYSPRVKFLTLINTPRNYTFSALSVIVGLLPLLSINYMQFSSPLYNGWHDMILLLKIRAHTFQWGMLKSEWLSFISCSLYLRSTTRPPLQSCFANIIFGLGLHNDSCLYGAATFRNCNATHFSTEKNSRYIKATFKALNYVSTRLEVKAASGKGIKGQGVAWRNWPTCSTSNRKKIL